MNLEDVHRIALARELTATAGVPLRDRYGYAASDETVLYIVNAVFAQPDDKKAADDIGCAGALGDIEIAMGYDEHTDEAYERAIVAALRPLVDNRRDAAVRSLR